MAARKRKSASAASPVPRRRQAALAFDALTVEGGLLSPEWLARVAQLTAIRQSESDYRIPKGLNLRDEIGRYWRVAQALWSDLHTGLAGNAERGPLAERFICALLCDCFGFASLTTSPPVVFDDRSFPIGHAALSGRVPVVIAPAGAGLDTRFAELGDSGRSRSAFGLAQEYLNAAENAHWGLVSDGLRLRLLRDNASLTRPAWIEADLSRIFTEQLYPDFTALWLLAHESRYGASDAAPTDSPLETWRIAGREEGTRAREHLRSGVEEAVLALGQGFLSHPENSALRKALEDGSIRDRAYFQELLRVVYRMIFLLTAEERGLLHPDSATDPAKVRYAAGYALRRLRERSIRRSAHDRFHDLWESLTIVFRGLASGESALGLPALAGLFAADQCPALDVAKLENHHLLTAIFKLAWLKEDGGLARVNWRDMGPEELGSVYESLLELVPRITENGRLFSFATGAETKGNARKTTGSYYTPDSLVQVLLDSALEPVVTETIAKHPENPIEALLSLTIVDPACGSGHFLLAAARRLAAHIARLQAKGTPSAADYRHALRQVVGRCIFGVDLNPMAVELCKVSLWMEAVEPGLPLSFLDSHIQHGNSLLGTTPELMVAGIPDAAWDPIEGDDKKTASLLKKRNKQSAGGQRSLDSLWSKPPDTEVNEVRKAVSELDAAPDSDAAALASKETRWEQILESPAYRHQRFVADMWCAAFVWPKQPGPLAEAAPTNSLWLQIRDGQGHPPPLTTRTVEELAAIYRFFHWHLAFPQVFGRGGFDVVIGNPPWDSLLFREEEFFAGTRPDIAGAATAAKRKALVSRLAVEDPRLFSEYQTALRATEGASAFARSRVRFPLTGVGRVNLFALFAELARLVVGARGRIGQILPSGIVTDDSTKLFFQSVVDGELLISFYDFENRLGIFPTVHRSFKFGLLTLAGSPRPGTAGEFAFFATEMQNVLDPERRFSLNATDIALLNPATKTCPVFRSRRDSEITKAIYRRLPILTSSGWGLELRRLLNSADDSADFEDSYRPGLLPLYEGKYFHQMEHRWATYDGSDDRDVTSNERSDPSFAIRTRFWFSGQEAKSRFGKTWQHSWVIAWRDIARSTDERTFIAAVVPSLAVPDTAKVAFLDETQVSLAPCLLAVASSFVFDFVARQKIGGTHMSAFIVEQLPLLAPETFGQRIPWAATSIRDWITSRAMELTFTAKDIEPFARDVGYNGPPFPWNAERRRILRAELDAAFFHLYGLSRADAEHILGTFPIVQKHDEKAYRNFRTRDLILGIYDALAEAVRTKKPYHSLLDSPAAVPRSAPADPIRIPVYAAYDDNEDGARFLWAALIAAGGTIPLLDLALAFALRSDPDLLLDLAAKHAKSATQQAAREWRARVPHRAAKPGFLTGLLTVLGEREAVRRRTEKSRPIVAVGRTTPAAEKIGDWFFFEARLLLEILRALPEDAAKVVDDRIAKDDRKLRKAKKA